MTLLRAVPAVQPFRTIRTESESAWLVAECVSWLITNQGVVETSTSPTRRCRDERRDLPRMKAPTRSAGRPRRDRRYPQRLGCADLTSFCRLDELGLAVIGQRLDQDRAVLACRVVDPDDWCHRCGCQGVPRDGDPPTGARTVRLATDHLASDGVPVRW